MTNENINMKRVDRISKYIKDTVDCSYRAGYGEGFNAGKLARTNDLDDVTLMSLRSLKSWLEHVIPVFEIVYCKDCERCKPLSPTYQSALGEKFIGKKKCVKFNIVVSEDDYCSFANPEESEEE